MAKHMKELYLVADKIKKLREENGLTQAQLARILHITRSSVNAWEMGVAVPSTQLLVQLAQLFRISTDHLLGLHQSATICVDGLTDDDVHFVHSVVEYMREKNRGSSPPSRKKR